MESIDPECTKLKQRYEACFYAWYSEKFLKGDTRDECQQLFAEYRACLERALKSKKIDHLLEEHQRLDRLGSTLPSKGNKEEET